MLRCLKEVKHQFESIIAQYRNDENRLTSQEIELRLDELNDAMSELKEAVRSA